MHDHTLSCACKLPYMHLTISDIRPHITWAVSVVISDGHLIFLQGFYQYVWIYQLDFPVEHDLTANIMSQSNCVTDAGKSAVSTSFTYTDSIGLNTETRKKRRVNKRFKKMH